MTANRGRKQPMIVWLGVGCLALLPLGPLHAQKAKLRDTLKGHTHMVSSVAFSPDGKTLASGSMDKTVRLWDVATGREKAALKGHTQMVFSVAFSPDGKTLASGSEDKTIKLWNVETGKEKAALKGHTGPLNSLAYSPDGQTLASGSEDKTIKLWDAATGKEKATLKGHTEPVWSVAYRPDGKMLASGSRDNTIKLWDVATGKEQATLKGDMEAVFKVAFSPDGKTLASVGGSVRNGSFTLWDMATGKEKATLKGHAGEVLSVAFSPDGKTLASGSADKLIKLWDVATGKEKATLEGHTGEEHSLAFSPDGKTLASGSADRTIKLWDVPAAREPVKPTVKPPLDDGFDSPQAATEALFAAMSKKDWKAGFRCFTAEGQELAVVHLIDMTQFVAGGTKKEKDLEMLLKKHGFDVVKVRAQDKEIEEAFKKDQKPLDNRKEVKRYADQIKDKEAFFAEVLTWVDKNFGGEAEAPAQKKKPQEAAKKDQEPPDLRKVIKDLKIKGDTATGKLNQQWTVEFRRVNGRWFVDSTEYDDPDDLFLLDYLDDIHGWSL